MFDRHYKTEDHSINYPDTININRAPTDDSVKLLREMEDKARAQVISAFALESNDVRLSYVMTLPLSGIDKRESVVVFKLNDREYRVQMDMTKADRIARAFDNEGAVKEMHRVFAEAVSDVLFRELFTERNVTKLFGK